MKKNILLNAIIGFCVILVCMVLKTFDVSMATVFDKNGHGIDENGYYISYQKIDCQKYDEYMTICIHNPLNFVPDDIIARYDIKIGKNDNIDDVDGKIWAYGNVSKFWVNELY